MLQKTTNPKMMLLVCVVLAIVGVAESNIVKRDDNACTINPCQNNGTCTISIYADLYRCKCAEGFGGVNCTYNTNVCLDNICDNGGTLVSFSGEERNCFCYDGQKSPCTNLTDCANSLCFNNATYYGHADSISGYTCSCRTGFTGRYCEINAAAESSGEEESDSESSSSSSESSSSSSSSSDTNEGVKIVNIYIGSHQKYNILCPRGYTGTNCETKCFVDWTELDNEYEHLKVKGVKVQEMESVDDCKDKCSNDITTCAAIGFDLVSNKCYMFQTAEVVAEPGDGNRQRWIAFPKCDDE